MFITYVYLSSFKRSTDLSIELTSLKQSPKLVLLIGSNGSGKSSVFDGFEAIAATSKDKWEGDGSSVKNAVRLV